MSIPVKHPLYSQACAWISVVFLARTGLLVKRFLSVTQS